MMTKNDMRTATILSDVIMRMREKELVKVSFSDYITGEKITFELFPHSETMIIVKEAL